MDSAASFFPRRKIAHLWEMKTFNIHGNRSQFISIGGKKKFGSKSVTIEEKISLFKYNKMNGMHYLLVLRYSRHKYRK